MIINRLSDIRLNQQKLNNLDAKRSGNMFWMPLNRMADNKKLEL